jgi:hypothetical protein
VLAAREPGHVVAAFKERRGDAAPQKPVPPTTRTERELTRGMLS